MVTVTPDAVPHLKAMLGTTDAPGLAFRVTLQGFA
jgi:hypothetical protein